MIDLKEIEKNRLIEKDCSMLICVRKNIMPQIHRLVLLNILNKLVRQEKHSKQ